VNRGDIHFPPKHEPLRDDVHALGALIGEILREQGGEQLLELVERDRIAAIRGRGGDSEARAGLAANVAGRAPALARDLVRAFSTWFQAVNVAEKVHRIRRRREYFLKDSQRPQPGGVEDAIASLKGRGLSHAQVLELIAGLSIEPVFAPHSTEASRRTLLRKQQRIAMRLLERLDPSLTPNEARNLWNNIRMELTTAWQTEELPRERLTVADEREQILFYLVEILYRVVPAFYEEIIQALEKVYGTRAAARRARQEHPRDACPPASGDRHQLLRRMSGAGAAALAEREPRAGLSRTRQAGRGIHALAAGGARHHAGAPRPHAVPGVPGADRRAPAQRLRRSRERLRECAPVSRRHCAHCSEPQGQQGGQRGVVLRRAAAAAN
jgi:hypothetical protein